MNKKAPAVLIHRPGLLIQHSRSREGPANPLSGFSLWNSRGDFTVTCHSCRVDCRKFGKRQNRQRYQCFQCRKVFTNARDNTLDGMYLPVKKAEMVLRLLLEGNSVSSVVRLTNVHQKTILKLLVLAGEKCERIMADKIRNVEVRDLEMDEVWSWIGKKQKRVRPE